MVSRVLAAAVLLAAAAILLVLAWPQLLHLERTQLIAQAISFRFACLLGGVAIVVVALLVALVSRRARRLFGSLALVAVAFCLLEGVVVADRGTGDPSLPTAAAGDITVLEWNTLGDAPDSRTVADLLVSQHVDVLVMPETTVVYGTAVARQAADGGLDMAVLSKHFDLISKARSTTMLVAKRLGEYRMDESLGSTGQLPSIVARPVSGTGPVLVAVHAVSPVPAEFSTWSSDLDWAARACVGPDLIMAGDFNSTTDHWAHLGADGHALGECTDAATATGNAAVGTWPTSIPPLVGTPIDHVLTTAAWRVTGMRVIQDQDTAGSDHRPILAQLTPATVKP